MKPIVSVVVPTKNRYKYLKLLISLIESFNDSRIELLVHDNSDDNAEIKKFLQGKTLLSTRYYYDPDKLSMCENAERGINKANGDYICFIGDDDAVCRNIADCAEWMSINQIDAVRSLYLQYSWNEGAGGNKGYVYYEKLSCECQIGDPVKELKTVLNNGVPEFGHMAKIYHGIVKKTILEEVQKCGGCLFPGPTPDMSGAVSIAFFIKRYAMLDVPIVIPGLSCMVGGGVMGKVLALNDVAFITDSDRMRWPSDYPPLWATELIWPVCALNALRSINRDNYIKELNKNKMLSRLVAVHRTYFKEAFRYADIKMAFICEFVSYFIREGFAYVYENQIKSRISGKLLGKYTVVNGFESIANAEAYLMDLIRDFSFNNIIIKD